MLNKEESSPEACKDEKRNVSMEDLFIHATAPGALAPVDMVDSSAIKGHQVAVANSMPLKTSRLAMAQCFISRERERSRARPSY
ncbi:hypothetical protein TELCIR_10169 [Teladorsagia circumcincta]|uniref:Uncharacterized protein n=1 Tax=Teladorsagia circumcincta TaxID=45464 RepID=A0A2G9UCT4_TELCI|nr:hypothetical protein TELCIR_10169 [Teladorsagia circumcincta]